ncbi:hypothetical protein EV702DRAFT_1044495 [Suillus placidus]|uniref:Uncharacterized protein n=1 Tax=Suillus placidus TaxID=48579 RepID=A0A9P7D4W6_9AGAM|nr:hypothetical protein EV702DRAFT_1044495 [Suillus placidus]
MNATILRLVDRMMQLQDAILNFNMASAIIFSATRFQPLIATHFLLALAEQVVIEKLNFRQAFPSLLSLSSHLGQHSKAQGMPYYKFHIDKPPGSVVNAAKSKSSGWFQSPSTTFLLPSSVVSPGIQGNCPGSRDREVSIKRAQISFLLLLDILALHQDGFVAASQETCRGILRIVWDHIVSKNKSEDESVELPKAISHYYCQFLTNEDDIWAEDELLGDEPEDEPYGLSPEEREAAAHPKDAAFYKKEASDWDVAQKLFKQEIDEYDKEKQAKLGVKN